MPASFSVRLEAQGAASGASSSLPAMQTTQAAAQPPPSGAQAASSSSQTTSQSTPAAAPSKQAMLDKAYGFEARGRLDLAAQTWQQLLQMDPNNADALGGLARAAKAAGNRALSQSYLERLRAVQQGTVEEKEAPGNGSVAAPSVQGSTQSSAQQKQVEQLQQAGELAEAGKYAAAMAIYREVMGDTPPPGEWSLVYYETEAATEDGRPHAIAGLRALAEKFPNEARYKIELGRILTYNPKTREEGRRYLERYPGDRQADEALRQSLLWDSSNPAFTGEIRAYLATHTDPQLAAALQATQPQPEAPQPVTAISAQTSGVVEAAGEETPALSTGTSATTQTAMQEQSTIRARHPASMAPAALTGPEAAAYKALNARHIDQAEAIFKGILERQPNDPGALAGMGYIRMEQGNFLGAISFLETAMQGDPSDPGLAAALDTARFWFLMGEGQSSLSQNDLIQAEKQYRAALAVRPSSPEALAGLADTLMKAGQPLAAGPLYEHAVENSPTSVAGWRGLLLAEAAAGNSSQALATDRRIPAAIHAQLMRDPAYLHALATSYSAAGRDPEAQRTLEAALQLPPAAEAKSERAEMQTQLAGILLSSNHLEQAAALYSQALAQDHGNTAAWRGLVSVQHALGHDPEALATVEGMPPASYSAAMRDPGFEATVASVYQTEGKLDVAQDLLEKASAELTGAGQKTPVGIAVQLAGIYSERGNYKLAIPLYQRVLTDDPSRTDAWAELLFALHAAGQDKEAVAEAQKIPAATRAQLENDVNYLQTMESVYQALGQSQQALLLLNRVQQVYAAQHSAPPADIDIQNAWLLYNSQNDTGLYRQLMDLGGRPDLSEEQSRTVQAIWTNWAVRRANQTAAAGNSRRALAILNAAARAFPDNPAVLRTLANGYTQAGEPGKAVLIYKEQNLASASVEEYQAAVSAALAADDIKDAGNWLRFARTAFPKDPRVVLLDARYEQARGNTARAIEEYRASLKAMPPPDPGAELAAALRLPGPSVPSRLPNAEQEQDLSILLAPRTGSPMPTGSAYGAQGQPYLPSYDSTYAYPSGQSSYGQPYSGTGSGASGVVPPYMTNPGTTNPGAQPASGGKGGPQGNSPQSSLDRGAFKRPGQSEVEVRVGSAVARVLGEPLPGPEAAPSPTHGGAERPAMQSAPPVPEIALQSAARTTEGTATAQPPLPLAVRLGDNNVPRLAAPQAEVTDVLPTARYVANARAVQGVSSHPAIAAAEAAEIRRHQSDVGPETAVQHGRTSDGPIAANEEDAQYLVPLLARNQGGPQIAQPSSVPSGPVGNIPDTGTQQYPQPSVAPAATPTRTRAQATGQSDARRRTAHRSPVPMHHLPSYAPAPYGAGSAPLPEEGPATPAADLSARSPSSSASPMSGQPYPLIGSPYPLTPPLNDSAAMQQSLPPVGSEYDEAQGAVAMTPRQEAESELASLEGSYSGWLGVTFIGRYRSGTAGLDRLTDVEAPSEASAVLGRSVRLTAVAVPVFLNSGTLNPSVFTGGKVPYLGTMPANTANPPAQQVSNGVGGELQLATKDFDLAAGYTPYNFLIQNVTGHLGLRLFDGHITLFADRDPVKDTQLSYAGLRDPGTITPTYVGNAWGGVVSSTGGARIDLGSGGSGIYLSGEGGVLHGYHVLNNTMAEGSMGAYLRVKSWPNAGSLTLGGTLFGSHYKYNEVGLTYGQGGYFSPRYFFLAALPVSFNGAYGSNFHYQASGAFGVQTFQQDLAIFYPLDPGLVSDYVPASTSTDFNYDVNSEASYRFGKHWYLGGFVSANNTNNYNDVSAGFFFRYALHRQHSSQGHPTGLFPVEGPRPLRVP